MNKTAAELQHAINMLLEQEDWPIHTRMRIMALQAQLLEVEQLERIATALEKYVQPSAAASSDVNYAGDAERAEFTRMMEDDDEEEYDDTPVPNNNLYGNPYR